MLLDHMFLFHWKKSLDAADFFFATKVERGRRKVDTVGHAEFDNLEG